MGRQPQTRALIPIRPSVRRYSSVPEVTGTTDMHPADLADERERRVRRAYRAFAEDLHHAQCAATPAEAIGLEQLAKDCLARTISPEDAREYVLALRRTQNQRAAARAA